VTSSECINPNHEVEVNQDVPVRAPARSSQCKPATLTAYLTGLNPIVALDVVATGVTIIRVPAIIGAAF
jgi:hypothetical protein